MWLFVTYYAMGENWEWNSFCIILSCFAFFTQNKMNMHTLDQPFVPTCTVHRSYSLHIAILLSLLAWVIEQTERTVGLICRVTLSVFQQQLCIYCLSAKIKPSSVSKCMELLGKKATLFMQHSEQWHWLTLVATEGTTIDWSCFLYWNTSMCS